MKRRIVSGTADRFQEARDRLQCDHIKQISDDLLQFMVDLRYSKDVEELLTSDDILAVDGAYMVLRDLAEQLSNTPGFN